MVIRVVRLGSARLEGEGTRIGTVRRPPRGVRKDRFAADDWFDVWYPELSPSAGLVTKAQDAKTDAEWAGFVRAFKAEMAQQSRALDLLVALSRQSNLSVGCYCEDEARCHRSVLRELLAARGATIA